MTTDTARPPLAPRRPHSITQHGRTRVDDYFWLRERENPEVIHYLQAENAYAQAVMAHTRDLQERLFQEMRGRLPEADSTVPEQRGPYLYYTRLEPGRQYALHCRRHAHFDAPEEILLDVNALAEGRDYCKLGAYEISPDHRWLAFSVDYEGNEIFILRIKDLTTGALAPEAIFNTYYSVEWANDSRTLFYNTLDHAHRPYRVYRHTLGSDPAADVLVHHETDESFFAWVRKSRSRAFLFLHLHNNHTSEWRYLSADQPNGEFVTLRPRQPHVEYSVAHHSDRFLILINDHAPNFKLMEAPLAAPDPAHWRERIPPRADVLLEGLDAFQDHLVIYERAGGLKRIRLSEVDGDRARYVDFPEPVYTFTPEANPEFETHVLRFTYSSLVTPDSVIDYDMRAGTWTVRKQLAIPSGYDPTQYVVQREMAPTRDGQCVPISLVYRRDLSRDERHPLLLLGYGAYGATYEPGFDSRRLSLIDRGLIVAIAHVRGGSEMGRAWYEQGKLRHKQNTFDDFIACAEHLIAQGYTAADRLAALGTSAGGLLMGAVVTQRPDLFGCVVARVPFVDVINTLNDADIPLTVIEWDEWGNPQDPEQFDYLLAYSPYDNLQARAYPHLLVTAGLNDPRVQYWEPAKFVARLRALHTGDQRLLLKTNLDAGHAGASGRYDTLRETAFEYAFILDTLGLVPAQPDQAEQPALEA